MPDDSYLDGFIGPGQWQNGSDAPLQSRKSFRILSGAIAVDNVSNKSIDFTFPSAIVYAADATTLEGMSVTAIPDGAKSWVLQYRDYFVIHTVTADYPTDGIVAIASDDPLRVWLREGGGDLTWRQEPNWFIDPASGLDSRTGLTSGQALKTWDELMRRWGRRQEMPLSEYVVTIMSAGGTIRIDQLPIATSFTIIRIVGNTTNSRTGTISTVTSRDRSGAQTWAVQDAGVVSWAADVDKQIIMTAGASVDAIAWVAASSGTAGILTEMGITFPEDLEFDRHSPTANTYAIRTLMASQLGEINFPANLGGGFNGLVVLENVDWSNSVSPIVTQNTAFLTGGCKGGIILQNIGGLVSINNHLARDLFQIASVAAGARSSIGAGLFAALVIEGNVDVFYDTLIATSLTASNNAHLNQVGFIETPGVFITGGVVTGVDNDTDLFDLWGHAGAVGVTVSPGAQFTIPTKPHLRATVDFSLGGANNRSRGWDPSTGAYTPATIPNTWVNWGGMLGSGGFGNGAVNPILNARIIHTGLDA